MDENVARLLAVPAILAGFALLFHGWPRFFTINIHKHYHEKNKPNE